MLELQKVTVSVGSAVLVSDVSLSVFPGRLLAVVGANGAGKTTALRALAGDIPPTTGRVLLDGADLHGVNYEALARRRAVLSQKSPLPFDFTALEVVLLGRTPHETRRSVDIESACEAMSDMEVLQFAGRRYRTLSGGEQQRVQVARVLAQLDNRGEAPQPSNPPALQTTNSSHQRPNDLTIQRSNDSTTQRYLLLDEPTSALDLAHQHHLLETARRTACQGVGVMIVLHDLNLTAQYADDVAVLKGGRLIASGSPWQVLTSEVIQDAFGISAVITEHPNQPVPLVVPVPATRKKEKAKQNEHVYQY